MLSPISRGATLVIFLASCVSVIIVTPITLVALAMSFDAPNSTWTLLHVPVIALPVLLIALAVASGLAVFTNRPLPLGWILLLLMCDIAMLAAIWMIL